MSTFWDQRHTLFTVCYVIPGVFMCFKSVFNCPCTLPHSFLSLTLPVFSTIWRRPGCATSLGVSSLLFSLTVKVLMTSGRILSTPELDCVVGWRCETTVYKHCHIGLNPVKVTESWVPSAGKHQLEDLLLTLHKRASSLSWVWCSCL